MKRWMIVGLIGFLTLPGFGQLRLLWETPPWFDPSQLVGLWWAAVDSQGSLCIGGTWYSNGTYPNFLTAKYSSDGRFLWEHIYSPGYVRDIVTDSQDNVIVTGQSYGGTTLKYAPDGTLLWARHLREIPLDTPHPASLAIDAQDNVIVAGDLGGTGGASLLVVKYAPNGNLLWAQTYGPFYNAFGEFILVDSQNNLIVCGEVQERNIILLKYSPEGNLLWIREYDDTYDIVLDCQLDAQDNIYLKGSSGASIDHPGEDYVLTYDAQSNLRWRSVVNNTYYGGIVNMSMVVAPSGEVYVSHYFGSLGGWQLMKLNPLDGSLLWQRPIALPRGGQKYIVLKWRDPQGNLYGVGSTRRQGERRLVLAKFDREGWQKWLFESPDPWPVWANWLGFGAIPDGRGHIYASMSGYLVKMQGLPVRSEGDLNGDECVSDLDLARVLFGFETGDGSFDVNGDGIVDEVDLRIVLENFGLGCGG